MIPLLSPHPFAEFTAESYHAYIKSLYREPERAAPPAEFSLRLNKKGTPVITVRRSPKWLSFPEALTLSKEHGINYQELVTLIKKRKIELRRKQAGGN